MPSRLSDICPRPSFPGPQEFFSDFISVADSYVLNRHLSDAFLAKITEVGGNVGGFRFYFAVPVVKKICGSFSCLFLVFFSLLRLELMRLTNNRKLR